MKTVGKNLTKFNVSPAFLYVRDVDGKFHQIIIQTDEKYLKARLVTNKANKEIVIY